LYAGEQLANSDHPEIKIKIKNLIDSSCWFENDKRFIEEFEELLSQIENLDFYGGEPFLLKNLPKVLKTIVDIDRAQHIRLHFNTNGSVFPKHLVDTFKEFKKIDMAISLDSIGSRFEYERGGTWTVVSDNIKKLKQLHSDKINVYLFPTVNIQNVLYLDEVYAWAQDYNLSVFLNFLESPEFLNIDYMTPEANELVIAKFQNSKILELQNISTHLKKSRGNNGQKFRDYMQKLDNWRNESFSLTHPEIANAMRYVL
jgi:MoaA/NifB/PqqE/SkfB family radical SAM enzyme